MDVVWQRYAEIAWVLDCIDDLDADFYAVYGVDMYELPADRMFKLARRVINYEAGMIHRKLVNEKEREKRNIPGYKPGEEVKTVSDDSPQLKQLMDQMKG